LKRIHALLAVFLILSLAGGQSVAVAADSLQLMWTRVFGSTLIAQGTSVVQTSDEGFAVAGYSALTGKIILFKVDSSGNPVWNRTYGPDLDCLPPSYVKQTADGGYAVVGAAAVAGRARDVLLVRTDSQGAQLWNRTYGGTGNDIPAGLEKTADGGFAIVADGGPSGFSFIRTDSSGGLLVNKSYTGSGYDTIWSFTNTTDSGYVVTGVYNYYNTWLMKMDSNGTILWNRNYSFGPTSEGHSVYPTPGGEFLVSGLLNVGVYPNVLRNVLLFKVNSSGNLLWNRTYIAANDTYFNSIAGVYDGGYALAGGNSSHFWVIRADNNGTTTGSVVLGNNTDWASYVITSSDSGIVAVGTTNKGGTASSIVLVKLMPAEVVPEYPGSLVSVAVVAATAAALLIGRLLRVTPRKAPNLPGRPLGSP
jgi:hypothetical protein